jgi:hypothetical protein
MPNRHSHAKAKKQTRELKPQTKVAQAAQPAPGRLQKEPSESERRGEQARLELLRELPELPAFYCRHLSYFLQLLKADRGCVTPIEEFITDLVWRWAESSESPHLALDPDVIVDDLINGSSGLREHFDDAVETTRLFNARYAAALTRESGIRPGDVESALREIEGNEALRNYGGPGSDPQQTASHLQTARDLYAAVPHLVTRRSAEFNSQLEEIAVSY